MLTIFPDLLTFGLAAPFLIRIAVGLTFLEFGWSKLRKEKSEKATLFEAIGLRPGGRYALAIGILELAIGVLLIIGLFTQGAALAALAVSFLAYRLKRKHPEGVKSDPRFLLLLGIMSVSLLFSGAGFFAFDLPL